jgi:hypothetical protein
MNPKHFGVLLVVATVITCVSRTVFCQGMQYGAGGRMYNPNSELTVNGTVEEVRTMTGRRGFGGTHLDLKTDSGVFDVHLGPSSYPASKGFRSAKGDRIEVTGSKQTFYGHDAIIARQVKAGGKMLTLRNAQGIPEWSGGRRGGGAGAGRGMGGTGGGPPASGAALAP